MHLVLQILAGIFLLIMWEREHRYLPHPWYGCPAFDWSAFNRDPANARKLRRFVRHGGRMA